MFPPYFTRQPEFQAFRAAIGSPYALEYLFNLCSMCQVSRQTEMFLPIEYVPAALGFQGEATDPEVTLSALLKYGMITRVEGKENYYSIELFKRHNAQLRSCWRIGKLGGRPPKSQAQDEEDVPF